MALKKFRQIEPDPSDIASLRKKMMEIIRRMQRDYEMELKPLIKRMTKENQEEAKQKIEEAQKIIVKDSLTYYTAYEAALKLHVLKSSIVEACQLNRIKGAVQKDGEWIIPEDSLEDYGISIGKIDPEKDLMDRFNERLKRLAKKYEDMISSYQNMAEQFTEKIYRDAKKKFMKQFEKQVGIDILKKLQEKGLKDAFDEQVRANVALIKSVPSTFFQKIQEMVTMSSLGQKKFEGGLVKAIEDLTQVTRNKAKLIARDQSSKAVSTFTQLRLQNLGSESYIWRNAGDRRVAGNPSGLYPNPNPRSKAHGDHWHREGKEFFWDNPPPDGHPGIPINCRCYAEPVFKDYE